jgi:hypothetical protein
MGLTPSPTCGACSLEAGSAFHFLCVCPTLSTLRLRNMGKPIISASEYSEIPASVMGQFPQKMCLVFGFILCVSQKETTLKIFFFQVEPFFVEKAQFENSKRSFFWKEKKERVVLL